MTYPHLPEAEEVASHFVKALANPEILEEPYRRWQLRNVFPESMCTGILTLPIAPPVVTIDTKGARDTFNNQRIFFTPKMRELFPAMSVLSDAMQRPEVALQFKETCGVKARAVSCAWSTSRIWTACGLSRTATSRKSSFRW